MLVTQSVLSRAALENHAADLLRLLEECETDLPTAANGKKVAWADKYPEQVYKDIRAGQSQEVKRLLAVLVGFLARGAKLPRVLLFVSRLHAIVAASGRTGEPRPIRILNRRETREDAFFDMAQMRLEADTDDVQALEGIVRQGAFYRAAIDELIAEAQDRIIVLRSSGPSERRLSLVRSNEA